MVLTFIIKKKILKIGRILMEQDRKNRRLYEKLKESILGGILPPGYRFLPEISYARQLGVSRNTLRSALKWLEKENMIVRGRGKGTFVNRNWELGGSKRYMLLLDSAPPVPYTEHIIPQIMLGIEQALRGRDIELEHCSYEHLKTLDGDEIAGMLLQLALEFFCQRKGVGYRAGKAGNDLVLIDLSHLLGAVFHDGGLAHGHLSVAADADVVGSSSDCTDRGCVKLYHFSLSS